MLLVDLLSSAAAVCLVPLARVDSSLPAAIVGLVLLVVGSPSSATVVDLALPLLANS